MAALWRDSNLRRALGLALLVAVVCLPAPAGAGRLVDYIYIDASEGNSSGGHAAIRFGAETYHYQYFEPSILRSVLSDSEGFEFDYRFLENRNLHVSHIAVSEQTYALLRAHFNHRHLIQAEQFDYLESLREDAGLLRLMLRQVSGPASGEAVPEAGGLQVPGAGLFRTHGEPSQVAIALRERIARRHGQRFLDRRMEELRTRMEDPALPGWAQPVRGFSADSHPPSSYTFSRRYVDLLTGWLALGVLKRAAGLQPEAFHAPEGQAFRLNDRELAALRRFRLELEDTLLRLVRSRRPDWGYPFLVGLARLMTLDQTLRSGRLVFLDSFAPDDEAIDAGTLEAYPDLAREFLDEARAGFEQEKARLLPDAALSDVDYGVLERLANRYLEIDRGLEQKRDIRVHPGRMFPRGELTVRDLPATGLSVAELHQGLARIGGLERRYLGQLREIYRYDLTTRNCVTEIFRNIDQAFARRLQAQARQGGTAPLTDGALRQQVEQASRTALGGHIEATGTGAIPFVSARRVEEAYRVTQSQWLPSYRQVRLEQLNRRESRATVFLRESNTLTSTIYHRNPDDSPFLFFTEDTVWTRPVFGVFNTLTGAGWSIAGLLTLPVDGGSGLHSGLRGMITSLPELGFFSIRKGSYRFMPLSRLH